MKLMLVTRRPQINDELLKKTAEFEWDDFVSRPRVENIAAPGIETDVRVLSFSTTFPSPCQTPVKSSLSSGK